MVKSIIFIITCTIATLWASTPIATKNQTVDAVTAMRGMTISCQTYGPEWGTDAFVDELERLKTLGVNAVAIHPYASIRGNGQVGFRWANGKPPRFITRPVREAQARDMIMMIKPHLAYWGSRFSWRGEIGFDDPAAKARFFTTYKAWILSMAKATKHTDIFVIGTELKLLEGETDFWRDLIAACRKVTKARLTYAANWDSYQRIDFWDDLDFIGIQAYFPLSSETEPDYDEILAGWSKHLVEVRSLSRRFERPVVFTELGYNQSLKAAAEPWAYRSDEQANAAELQARCLQASLAILQRERAWLHGAFLWKWFVGPAHWENFNLNEKHMVRVIEGAWSTDS